MKDFWVLTVQINTVGVLWIIRFWMISLQTSRMPQKCCVPNCRGNYHKTKEHAEEKVSVFRFPSDPELRTKWVRMIPRQGLEFGSQWKNCRVRETFCTRICNKSGYCNSCRWIYSDGSTKESETGSWCITMFVPNNSSYLSSDPPKKRKSPAERFA